MTRSVTQKTLFSLSDGIYHIDSNLYLKVRGSSRSFIFRYTDSKGKRRDKSLGSARKISLLDAKSLALECRRRLALGDSIEKKKEKAVPTFEAFADKALQTLQEVKQWSQEKRVNNLKSALKRFAYPRAGKRLVSEIDRDCILAILKPIWDTRPATAKDLRGLLENILAYAIVEGYLESNPALWKNNLSMYLPPMNKVHTTRHVAAPTVNELRDLLSVLKLSDKTTDKALIFGALTATRKIEFAEAKWEEIDWDTKAWSIPPERRKDRKTEPHRVPLSSQAIKLLSELPRESDWIFTSRKTWTAIHRISLNIALKARVGNAYTVHGFRSCFRDWCAENGVDFFVAEKCLMHATGSTVVQAYQRSDLLEQRRPVMQRWADELINS